MGEQLDWVYLLEKAGIINEMIFRNRILKNENHELEHDIKHWLAKSEGHQHPAILFYRQRFHYDSSNMQAQFLKLRADFFNHFEALNEKQKKIHLISLINDTHYLVKRNLMDLTESLELYKLGLETGIILHEGKITYSTFVTIVAASNLKNSFDFTRDFIDNYLKKA